ncbi:MAG: polymer-forming cytoskeletal protein [Blastocatellia bacterium]|nr:polymer-forming cytoskeletal protein [Blastocatellia bacterium]
MKLAKNNGNDSAPGLLGKSVEVTGDILFASRLQVEGRVTGKLISDSGTLIIEDTGRVHAQVEVGVCVIRGTLEGNVNAKSRIEIHKTSRVSGDLTTPVLLIEEGAVFNGTIGMNQETRSRMPEDIPVKESEERIRVKGA